MTASYSLRQRFVLGDTVTGMIGNEAGAIGGQALQFSLHILPLLEDGDVNLLWQGCDAGHQNGVIWASADDCQGKFLE